MSGPRILFFDVETSPNTVYSWGLWNQNIGIKQMIESSKVLCWSAKWKGDKKVLYSGLNTDTHEDMITKAHALLDEADVVVTYNGKRFDTPTIQKEFVLMGLAPPAPFKQLDVFQVVKRKFRFPSNKLEYVAQKLGLGGKIQHEGFELWVRCMEGDPKAWKKMEKYNRHDSVLLEKVYDKLISWLPVVANHNIYGNGGHNCPSCGSSKLQRRGTSHSLTGIAQRFQCTDCGSWSQSVKTVRNAEVKGVA